MNNKLLKMNLQFFAADTGTDGAEGAQDGSTGTENENDFTEEQQAKVNEIVQARVAKEAAKNAKKAEQEKAALRAEIEEEFKHKQSLAELSEQERLAAEKEALEKQVNQLKAAQAQAELKDQALTILNDKGLPASFVNFVVKDDAENTLAAIEEMEKTYLAGVQKGVEERMKGTTPAAATGSAQTDAFDEAMKKNNYK